MSSCLPKRSHAVLWTVIVLAIVLASCTEPSTPSTLRVEVQPDRLMLEEGRSRTLIALVTGDDVSNADVTWSIRHGASDDRITAEGRLTAGALGTDEAARTIDVVATSVQDPDREGIARVTVVPAPPGDGSESSVRVEIAPETVIVETGAEFGFDAIVTGENVTDASVAWSIRGGAEGDVVDGRGILTAGPLGAGESFRMIEVTATSVQDARSVGTADVVIVPAEADEPTGIEAVLYAFEDGADVAPSVVRLDASMSASEAGPIVSYAWSVDGVATAGGGDVLDVYLATPGTHAVVLTVEDAAGNTDSEQLLIELSAAPSPYTIDVRFFDDHDMTLGQRRAFSAAARRWAEVVQTDFEPLAYAKPAGECGVPVSFDGAIDDLLVFASIADLDGPGGILAQAGPCRIDGEGFPLYGVMQFDAEDLDVLEGNGDLEDVVLHEMGHVLGIGTLWNAAGNAFLDPALCYGAPDPRFVGANAVREWREHGSGGVPVEPGPQNGTSCGHWREAPHTPDLYTELMTGYLDASMALSRITVGSLHDLGYDVDYGAADPWTPFPSLAALGAGRDPVPLNDVVLPPLPVEPGPERR